MQERGPFSLGSGWEGGSVRLVDDEVWKFDGDRGREESLFLVKRGRV